MFMLMTTMMTKTIPIPLLFQNVVEADLKSASMLNPTLLSIL